MKVGLDPTFVVFGGEHAGNEDVTLADAGEAWLLEKGKEFGITEERIKKIVVYAGNDEDTFAADEFAAHPDYTELHVVCSAGQIPRCWLNYSLKGWQPHLHPVTCLDKKPHQSMVYELRADRAVPAYFKEDAVAAVEVATQAVRQRHQDEMKQ